MPPPPIYLDECVRLDIVPALHARGFVVTSALEQGMTNRLPGHSEDDVLLALGHGGKTSNGTRVE